METEQGRNRVAPSGNQTANGENKPWPKPPRHLSTLPFERFGSRSLFIERGREGGKDFWKTLLRLVQKCLLKPAQIAVFLD
jgi:hypothetical protein